MKLVHDKTCYILQCTFEERHHARDAGFKWNGLLRQWYTLDLAVAAKLRDYAVGEAKTRLDLTSITKTPWPSPLPPPPDGLALLPHQVEAVRFALERNRSYLGLDPGLGKTIVAATIARALGRRVVYVTPPFLVKNVEEEFRRWAPDVDLTILRDSVLDRVAPTTSNVPAVLVVDEAHRFKNPSAKRTQALFGAKGRPGLVDAFARVVYMSGTPMPNRPIELHPVLAKAAPETIDYMNAFQYGRRFCAGHQTRFGWDFSGASNMEELARRVVGPFMLRQKKALLNLPPKLEEVFVVSDTMSPRLAKLDRTVKDTCGDADGAIKHVLAKLVDGGGAELHTATYRRLLGLEKVKAAVQYIESLLDETDESILVFAYHAEVVVALETALSEYFPYVVTGLTPMDLRHEQVKDFQTSDRRVMIANYATMVGFTLTKATRVVFVEFSWVPGENAQAGDRAHRIGQTEPVLVQYIVYKDSIDASVIQTLLSKQRAINHV